MSIRSHWDDFDAGTRQWLMDHPGCLIVPRTLASVMNSGIVDPAVTDRHGQIRLTDDDAEFIRSRAHTAFAVEGINHSFDAVQPGDTPVRTGPGSASPQCDIG
jgi:hypothetical protein